MSEATPQQPIKKDHLISSPIAADICEQIWKLTQSILQAKRSYQPKVDGVDMQDRIHMLNLQLLIVHASYDSPIPTVHPTLVMSVRSVFGQINNPTYRSSLRGYLNAMGITNQQLGAV